MGLFDRGEGVLIGRFPQSFDLSPRIPLHAEHKGEMAGGGACSSVARLGRLIFDHATRSRDEGRGKREGVRDGKTQQRSP